MNKWKIKKLFFLLPALLMLLYFIMPVFAVTSEAPVFISAATSTDGSKVLVTFDKDMGTLPEAPAGFSVTVDGVANPLTAVSLNENPVIIELSLTDTIYASTANIQVSYIAGTVESADGELLASFDNQTVTNNSMVVEETDATISPITATFDKNNPADIDVTMELNGNNLTGLKNGETELIEETDYVVSENIVTIRQAYLNVQEIGTCELTFIFSAGSNQVLTVTVVESIPSKVENTPSAPVFVSAVTLTDGNKVLVTFDKDMGTLPECPAGFAVTVDGVDNPLTAVELNENPTIIELSLTDMIYANAANIQVSYTAGTVESADGELLASFDNQTVTNNSMVVEETDATISPITATFAKNNPADIDVTMELNGNNLTGLKNGETELIEGTDYMVTENTVTIRQAYLNVQEIGTCELTFIFSAGSDPVLTVTIVENILEDPVSEAPVFVSASTSTDGSKVLVTFDQEMGILPESPAGFAVTVELNENPTIIELSLTDTIYASAANIQVSYTAGTVESADGELPASFDNQTVTNNSTISFPLLTFNYFYDSQNRLDYIELLTGQIIDYQYDINGNLIKKVLVN